MYIRIAGAHIPSSCHICTSTPTLAYIQDIADFKALLATAPRSPGKSPARATSHNALVGDNPCVSPSGSAVVDMAPGQGARTPEHRAFIGSTDVSERARGADDGNEDRHDALAAGNATDESPARSCDPSAPSSHSPAALKVLCARLMD